MRVTWTRNNIHDALVVRIFSRIFEYTALSYILDEK